MCCGTHKGPPFPTQGTVGGPPAPIQELKMDLSKEFKKEFINILNKRSRARTRGEIENYVECQIVLDGYLEEFRAAASSESSSTAIESLDR